LRPLSADLQPEIEAGLVMRELKLRGLVRRTLVVSPKGIATQWVAEMQTHFNEQFQLVLGDDIGTLQRLAQGAEHQSSAWSMFDQVIVSLDSVKSMDKRRGWTAERVAEYNRSRFEDLITSGRHIWDTLQTAEAQVQDTLGQDESITAHERLQEAVEQAGQELFDALQQAHLASVNREEERGMVAFTSRRKAIRTELGCRRCASSVWLAVMPRKLSGGMNCNQRGKSRRKSGRC
jgi:SNF2 family DNA or RNA helicase